MRCLFKPGDVLLVERARLADITLGDVVVLLDWKGDRPRYIVHRLLWRRQRGGTLHGLIRGDANILPDPLVPETSVAGRVIALRRGQHWARLDSPCLRWTGLLLSLATLPMVQLRLLWLRLRAAGLRHLMLAPDQPRPGCLMRMSRQALNLGFWISGGAFDRIQMAVQELLLDRRSCALGEGDDIKTPAEVFGVLDRRQVWSGNVHVTGDVYVPYGAVLRIMPGANVTFSAAPQWTCGYGSVFGDERHSTLRVGGRLEAEGQAPARILFRGERTDCWNGIQFLHFSGGAILSWTDVSDSRTAGISALSRARINLRKVRLKNNNCGIIMNQSRSEIILNGCEISGAKRHGIIVRGGTIRMLSSVVAESAESGLHLERGLAELTECRFERNETGVGVRAGRLLMRHCGLNAHAAAGLELEGPATHMIESTSIRDSATAIRFAGSRLEIRDLDISNCREGVMPRAGKILWKGGGVWGMRLGLDVPKATQAVLQGLAFTGSAGHGAQVRGGIVYMAACRCADNAAAGVYVENGSLGLSDCSFDRNETGIAVKDGILLMKNCGLKANSAVGLNLGDCRPRSMKAIKISGSPTAIRFTGSRLNIRGLAISDCREGVMPPKFNAEDGGLTAVIIGKSRRIVRLLVMRTSRWPGLRRAYRWYYGFAPALLRLWARRQPQLASIIVHRGYSTGDWEPGSSDIDLLAVAELAGEKAAIWLESFWKTYDGFKKLFPFLGECLVLEERELQDYLRWGGYRARTLSRQAKVVHGTGLPRFSAAATDKANLEVFGECAHAYTRLMQISFSSDGSKDEIVKVAAGKALLDLLRHAACLNAPKAMAASSRKDFADSSIWPELRPLMTARGEDNASWQPKVLRLSAEALADWHRRCAGLTAMLKAAENGTRRLRWIPPEADDSAPAQEELQRRDQQCEALRRALGESVIALSSDDLYRTYVVLDDEAMTAPALEKILHDFAQIPPVFGTMPILLSQRLWRLWSRTPYLESPARFLESEARIARAGAILPEAWQYSWRLGGRAPETFSDDRVTALARESLATLRFTWRLLGSEHCGVSPAYTAHYLYSRTLGLRLLLERGIAAPFFQLDRLESLFRDELPGELPEKGLCDYGRPGPGFFQSHYAILDSLLRRAGEVLGQN
jgi:hypothetical protein